MGLFSGIEKAEVFDKGRYLPEDFSGVLEIVKTIAKDPRQNGMAFIVEYNVVESNNDAFPVDSSVSWYQSMKNKDVALPSVKAWAAAVVGLQRGEKKRIAEELDPILEDLIESCCANESDNKLTGKKVRIDTVGILTRANKPFTRHDYSPYREAA